MPRNVEIKARVDDLPALALRVAALATQGPTPIAQDDSFFHCATGRLKLREFSEFDGELIFYQRVNSAGPKESFYVRSPTTSPATLREALVLSNGLLGRVVKQRTLYIVGRTRVHLDEVAGLGTFMELEVVLRDEESAEVGAAEAQALMTALDIAAPDLVQGAYLDLLTNQVTRSEKVLAHPQNDHSQTVA